MIPTTTNPSGNAAAGCQEFIRHVHAHYAGNNKLHEDVRKAHVLYQTSIMSALIEGVNEGVVTYGELAGHGDFGLGTFNDLDGEMVAFDGHFYQLKADGTARVVDPAQKTPFAAVCFFEASVSETVGSPLSMAAFHQLIDRLAGTGNLFFAIRVDGYFTSVTTRTVSKQPKATGLSEAAKNEATFTFKNLRGTLAGYRSPDYAQGLTVAGYHLHFINADKTGGGHVLDFALESGIIKADHYSSLFIALPETSEFKAANMDKDNDSAIKAAEG